MKISRKFILLFIMVGFIPVIAVFLFFISGFEKSYWHYVVFFITLLLFIFFTIFLSILFIYRYFSRPVLNLLSAIEKIQNGDIKIRNSYCRKDEFGQIAVAFNSLMDTIQSNTEQVRQSKTDLEIITQNIPGGVCCCALEEGYPFTYVNEGYLKLLGCTQQQFKQRYNNFFLNTIYLSDHRQVEEEIHYQLQRGNSVELQYRIIRPDKNIRWILERGKKIETKLGKFFLYCVLIDITETKTALEKLRESEKQNKILLEQSDNIICQWDYRKGCLDFVINWEREFGYKIQSQPKMEPFTQYIHPEDRAEFLSWLQQNYDGNIQGKGEFRVRTKGRKYIWTRTLLKIIRDEQGRPVRAIGFISNIDKEKKEKDALRIMSQTDALSGLYNQSATEYMVCNLLVRRPEEKHLFFILDIDNFKSINDTYGHQSGDVVVRQIAQSLQQLFPPPHIIGRIGGDEFVVFYTGIADISLADIIGENIVLQLKNMLGKINISVSVGGACYPQDGKLYAELLEKADQALYYAKKHGKNQSHIYSAN